MGAKVGASQSYLSDPRMRAVRMDACAALSMLPPPLPSAGIQLLDHIAPPHWTVEWYLPQWLGNAYDLPAEATHALILANVYGLGYIGLQDALADGEIDAGERTVKVCLSSAFYQLWIQQYVQCFPASSPFWQQHNHFMHQWWVATLESAKEPDCDFQSFINQSYLQLAWRGAPLKICCVGAQLLARREVDLKPLLAAIDHLLAAAVLLDHERDWQADLADGRYNAFIHFASPLPQVAQERSANRRRVLEKIILERASGPYFDLIQSHLQLSLGYAKDARCPQLLTYLQDFSQEIVAHQERLANNATALLRKTSHLLLGPTRLQRKERR
jgi:hypothetical protein